MAHVLAGDLLAFPASGVSEGIVDNDGDLFGRLLGDDWIPEGLRLSG